ncbi:aminopeptidase N-like [Uranotaenia lowii]|uniref:aminopeptidase N-like n=1 Tax=Uranotaenia lowii TaxID=190385 RepID=UPI00247A408B|nr:aminopeptidase N-like [Uranotaenia lowii]
MDRRMISVSAIGALLFLLVATFANLGSAQLNGDNYRLPNNSYPVRYDLQLTTHVHEDGSDQQFRFEGVVKIELILTDSTNSSITVNYRRINITHVKLWSVNESGSETVLLDDESSFELDATREFVTVTPLEPIPEGTYFLEFHYNGELREDSAGFYRSSYVDDEGRTRWLATTQFSSTDARHAFPCYDEPGIRAPIGLTVIHGQQYSVLSNNLPRESTAGPLEGYLRTVFDDTPKMQPYLLGIVVSDFASQANEQLYPRQKVFGRYNAFRDGEAEFILEAGHKILEVLERYLETDYALPKIYQVAIPDFAPGAMENYGLVTYKEDRFFFNNETSPLSQKVNIATVVGHEFGHQFFGNMVSPAWWSYLWLKEGFARYFEYLASDMVYPELRIHETYAVERTQSAFQLDSLDSTRPMSFYVNTQTEIAGIFDDIGYSKGGALMRKVQHAIGKEVFRKALINYLRAKAFQGATPEDFAAAIQKAIDESGQQLLPAGVTAWDVIKSWTEQKGFPVLHVSRGLDLKVHLTQERYLLNELDNSGDIWIIPYNFATARNPNFDATVGTRWMLTNETSLDSEGWRAEDWMIFNKEQTGYYRVNYDDRLWNLIIAQLLQDMSVIRNTNRAQLIDDSFNLARTGRIGYNTPMRLLAYLSTERDLVPWRAASSNLKTLRRLFVGSDQYDLFKRYLFEVINPAFLALGLVTGTSDDRFIRETRQTVASWACLMESRECISKSIELLRQSLTPPYHQIDPDLRNVIYCHGISEADRETFLAVWTRMQSSKDQSFRSELIYALGCTKDVKLKELFLNTSIADAADGVNYFGQEREKIFQAIAFKDRAGLELALKFFSENMHTINDLYNIGNFGKRAVGSAITGLANYIVDSSLNETFFDLMETLTKENLLVETYRKRAAEQVTQNLQWVHTMGGQIEQWLKQQYPTTTTTEVPTTTTIASSTTTETTTQHHSTTTEPEETTGTSASTVSCFPTCTTPTFPWVDRTTAEGLIQTTTEEDDGGSVVVGGSLTLLVGAAIVSFII